MNKNIKIRFVKLVNDIKVSENDRLSIWNEEDIGYLMPSEFVKIYKENECDIVILKSLDPENKLTKLDINKKFYFGHPGKIIAYGHLVDIL